MISPFFAVMRIGFTLAIFIWICIGGCTSKESKPAKSEISDIQQARLAGNEGDFISAIHYLKEAIRNDSTQAGWLDTLAQYYLQLNLNKAAENTIRRYLRKFPANEGLLKTQARVFELKGMSDSIIRTYDQLYLLTQKDKYLYYQAFYEWYGGDPKMAGNHIETLLSKKDMPDDSVEVSLASQGYFQMVNLKAAIYHLKADLDLSSGRIAEAKKDLQESLVHAPDFALAQEALRNFDRLVAMKRQSMAQ